MGEDLSMEEFVLGEENFHEGGAGFLALFKKATKNGRIDEDDFAFWKAS